MAKFNVEKTILANVPVERTYTVVRDFSQWKIWSPSIIAELDCKKKCQSMAKKIVGRKECR